MVQRFPVFQRWHVFVLFVRMTVCVRLFCSVFGCFFSKTSPVYKENHTLRIFGNHGKGAPKRPSMTWPLSHRKNKVFWLVAVGGATFLKTQKTESSPFSGNTRVGFWNLSRFQGKPRSTTPQKRSPHGNLCRLQGKPYFGTEMLLKQTVFYTFSMCTFWGLLGPPETFWDLLGGPYG